MKKIKSSLDKGLFINYFIRIAVFSAVSVFSLSAVFSFILYKLDLDISLTKYLSIGIVVISSFIIAYFSVKPFKNNGLLLGIISVVPLIIFSLINLIINSESIWIFLIKFVLCILIGGLSGIYSIKKRKKIRVK